MDFEGRVEDGQSSAWMAPRVETVTVHATHNAVKAEELSVFLGSKCLLANADLKISEQAHNAQVCTAGSTNVKPVQRGACYGLVGVNGCGKSTLLRLIASGRVPVPPKWKVFLVDQHLPLPAEHNAVTEVLTADERRSALLKEQVDLESLMVDSSECCSEILHEASVRLLATQSELAKWNGAEQEVGQILLSLGFQQKDQIHCTSPEPTLQTPMNELSGGWRMKVQLAKALWLKPELLLLDEPTNHLDFHATQWLLQTLEDYPYTSVVVSHDVSFLHGVCREILWMKDQKLESLPRDMVSQEDMLRMQRKKVLNFSFRTPEGNAAENHGVSLHDVEFTYGGSCGSTEQPRQVHVKKKMRFSGTSRSVLLGKNGSGKSTFLDLCVGRLVPTRGNVDRTPDVKIGHYSQFTDDLDTNCTDTPASYLVRECREELATHAGTTRSGRLQNAQLTDSQGGARVTTTKRAAQQQKRLLEIARGVLSNYGFEGDVAATVPVDRLSGGQKALLKFAVLSLRPANILFLDEPTNHLDAEACEALATALSKFKGGIVAVTHDELLIYRLIHCNWSTSELLVCRSGEVSLEKNVGANCLNALKNEVHRAEQAEVKFQVQRCHAQAAAQQHPHDNEDTAVVVTKNEVPPWLQSKRRIRDKHVAVSDATEVGPSIAVNLNDCSACELKEKELIAVTANSMPAENTRDRSISFHPRVRNHEGRPRRRTSPPAPDKLPGKTTTEPALDSWEDAIESDASTAPPEDRGECDDVDHDLALELNLVCTESFKQQAVPRKEKESRPESNRGRHSRLRKDLVNLNKAVAKWIRQKEHGEISNKQVLDNIKGSRVAQSLRASHVEGFDEDKFAQDALSHAAKSRQSI
jgi:ATPase subunit of ABC transporter with duplicated ATPase domains